MLKHLWLLALLSFALIGCNLSTATKSEESKPADAPKPTETAKFNVGDTVVAKWTGNSFYEGKIEKIDAGKITVKWSDGSSARSVDESDVYTLPKADDKPDVAVGDMVLAKTGSSSYWNGAEITKIEGAVYGVKTVESARTSNVDANKIIKITPATAANLKDKAGSTDFLKEAKSKKPEIAANFKAKNGEKVLAQWATNSWWSGKVTKVSGNKTTVAWDDGSKPSEVNNDKVMAYPTDANTKIPVANQFVLAKPASGSKWVYAQVVSVKDKTIEIKDPKGKIRTVKAGECVPLI